MWHVDQEVVIRRCSDITPLVPVAVLGPTYLLRDHPGFNDNKTAPLD